MAKTNKEEILASPEFHELMRRKNSISLVLTVLTLIVYFGFILMLAFGKELMAIKVARGVTLGIPLGVGVILLSWIFTGIYVRWANSQYDALVAKVRAKINE